MKQPEPMLSNQQIMEIVKPPKKRPKRIDYAACGLTPEGKIPYRRAERRKL